jgi:hypothetical protein
MPSYLVRRYLLAVVLVATVAGSAPTNSQQTFDLNDYWRRPLAEQGDAPAQWTELERSLNPTDCGACHADNLAQWQTSRHAHSVSPGLVAQLLDQTVEESAACLQCHATLAEQRIAFEAARERGVAQHADQRGLAAFGNSCGGCHVRHHQRFGPPQRETGATGQSASPAPHGGAFRTAAFEQSEFCSSCHQFPAARAVNGKPLENTYVEWRASPQAAQGMTCQSCHMPERAHVWRGIHDPAMVASGLTPKLTADADKIRFEVTNSGVGHAFPTYTVPTAVMNAVALAPDGSPRAETLQSHVIARHVRYDDGADAWVELSDTRLLPGQAAAIELAWDKADRIRVWLEIVPDDYYATQLFPELTRSLPEANGAKSLAVEALAAATASSYRLFETELRRP